MLRNIYYFTVEGDVDNSVNNFSSSSCFISSSDVNSAGVNPFSFKILS